MLKYIIKRLVLSVFILLGVSLIIYFLVRCMPIDYVEQKILSLSANTSMDATAVEKMKEMYGLTDNSFLGILKGYGNWLSALCRFDFGKSFVYGDSVLNVIVDRMGVSFAVAIIATVFEFLIAIPLGITAATHQYSLRDYIVTIFVMIGISPPAFFFGQVLKNLLAMKLGWFPPAGLVDATKSLTGMEENTASHSTRDPSPSLTAFTRPFACSSATARALRRISAPSLPRTKRVPSPWHLSTATRFWLLCSKPPVS